ncbi:ruBisCO large subunit-binding protein subunit beta, chloroplastic [Dorcoceras hygrometricum]|uniref:RuBisCO large subunit-binding protein subunit beta, chloroplastic n=1 Tax=Dorcoceras hygrometricum TaxID=472368 RepID=A0A2Z7ALX4_9LAMI|nr:ruBisCO large subunit-binding protein subunit beta, chloroplastic [Dorcoceras hygrometricum]
MAVEFEKSKLLLGDKKITNARDLINVLEEASKGGYSSLMMDEDIEQETLGTRGVNKMRGALKVAALKTPGFGERKSQYLDDIASSVAKTFFMSDCVVVEIIAVTGRNEQLQEDTWEDIIAFTAQFQDFNLGDKVASKNGGIVMGQTNDEPNKRARPKPKDRSRINSMG